MGKIKEKLQATRAKFRVAKVELPPELSALIDDEPIYVREMSAAETGAVESARFVTTRAADGKATSTYDMTADRERIICRCLCDASGAREYADDDVPMLSVLPRRIMDAIYEQALAVNGMEGGKSKALEKNSTAASGASPSGSPLPSGNGT